MSIRLSHPVPGARETDQFGWRAAIPGVVGAQLHTGQDWAAPKGTPVYAMHAGRVNRVWWDTMLSGAPAGGNMLQVGAAQCSSRYAHLDSYAVSLGQSVSAGDLVGYVGSTGAATGSHLHAELLISGQFVDPLPYINATPVAKSAQAEQGEDQMPDSMFAIVNNVPSWCWLNWATGKLYAVHTQKEADWIAKYMGSVKSNWAGNPLGAELYKSKLALFGILTKPEIVSANLTPAERKRIQDMLNGKAASNK